MSDEKITDLQSKLHALEAENRECISRFLHEQRVTHLENKIKQLKQELLMFHGKTFSEGDFK